MKKKIMWKRIVRVTVAFVFVSFLFAPFFQSCQKEEIIEPENVMLKSITVSGPLTFFTTPEELPCTGLPTEDFEEATNATPEGVYNPLDANTSTWFLPAGSILPGISFSLTRDGYFSPYTSPDLNIWAGSNDIVGHAVIANHQDETLIIEFTDDNVTVVGMTLLTIFWNQATFDINIYGNSDALLGTTSIIGGTPAGTYFGVQSEVPIKKITIWGFDYVNWGVEPPGVDDVMFGTCIVDSDGDGCLDSDDAVINSNMEEFVEIDGCSNGVLNEMTSECGVMMSDAIDALEAGDYKNSGQFVKAVASLAKTWMDEGLITQDEQTLLLACAGQSSIGSKK
ncbi:hypothetical protein ACUNWD_11090 [Sunxiuqinia sp. A32]|uniref:hypothetical protein n=1 Tax=Sunxiuqinia sp. A32 TaxID=3461496 RepID=UPI0040465199